VLLWATLETCVCVCACGNLIKDSVVECNEIIYV